MASDEIVEVLGNKYNLEMLNAASEAKSAQEFSDELGVPIATCYRRIDELTDVGLLELHDRPLSDEHRRIKIYKRAIDGVRIDFGTDGIDVTVEERSEVKNRLDEAWRRISND